MFRKSFAALLALSYLFVVLLSSAYALYRVHFAPANSEFSGMPALLLTLPWSFSIFDLFDSWLPNTLFFTFAVVTLSALINAILLYGLGALISHIFNRSVNS
jgi:hypothetical protein